MVDLAGENRNRSIDRLLDGSSVLEARILKVVKERLCQESIEKPDPLDKTALSSVMFLLGRLAVEDGSTPEICIVLNKRSKDVRQSGDLCCPGGTVEAKLDPYLAKLLSLPYSPLTRWPLWPDFRASQPEKAGLLSLLLAAALRESWEEMRLNPLGIRFLGPLPPQRLLLFKRVIYPMIGWIHRQRHFVPSWEVEKIVAIPLRSLLNPWNYANYRLHVPPEVEKKLDRGVQDMPCFLYQHQNRTEILWGATYRIVMHFLELTFGFKPPGIKTLPVVLGIMDENYLNGRYNG